MSVCLLFGLIIHVVYCSYPETEKGEKGRMRIIPPKKVDSIHGIYEYTFLLFETERAYNHVHVPSVLNTEVMPIQPARV